MSRPATGQVVERRGRRGQTFAIRFRAQGADITSRSEPSTKAGRGKRQRKNLNEHSQR